MFKQNFLGTINFGRAQKIGGRDCPRMPPVAASLFISKHFLRYEEALKMDLA